RPAVETYEPEPQEVNRQGCRVLRSLVRLDAPVLLTRICPGGNRMTIAPAAWAESAQRFRNAPPLPDLIEDLEFLRKTGEHPANAARRLGYDPRTLERRLMRAQ